MIELSQLREMDYSSDIASVKLYRTPWGVINDEARIEILSYDDQEPMIFGALGENEVLQLARDALSLLPGKDKLKMVTALNREIRARRSWNQIGRK